MDTSQLQAFEQIVRQGSFSKAARFLDISQPTISIRIQKLEEVVGGALFLRGGHRLELTELGRAFLPYARQALSVLAAGIETAQLTTRGKRGQIVIGTLPTLATGFFSSTLARLHALHPDLHIKVHTGHNQQIVEMLHDGFIKVGLMTSPFFSTELTTVLKIAEPLKLVAYADHPLARQDVVELADLKQKANPFFQVDWSYEVKQWYAQWIGYEERVFEVPPQTAYDLIRSGTGVALLTRAFVAADVQAGRLAVLNVVDAPELARESALVHLNSEDKLSQAIIEFIDLFQKEVHSYLIPQPKRD